MDGMHDLGGKQGFGKIRYSPKAQTYHAPWEKRVNAMTGLAVKRGIITQVEGEQLKAAHEAVAKVIEVDDFAPEALSPIYKKPADVHSFFQELGEQRAAS